MTIKIYISGICGSHEVRKQQQRVLFILQSLPIDLQIVDITEPGREEDLIFMQEEAKKHDKKTQLPPQIFNNSDYCGDYSDFELANDDDEILTFLKLEEAPSKSEISEPPKPVTQNGIGDHESYGVSNEMEEQTSNDISEINQATEQDVELAKTETNLNQVKDTEVDSVVTENAEITSDDVNVKEKTVKETSEEESEDEESE